MAAQSKKWVLAILLAVLFPALAVHVSCVAVIGPGSWGSGLEEKAPRFLAVEAGSAVSAYVSEFAGRDADEPTEDAAAASGSQRSRVERPASGGGARSRETVAQAASDPAARNETQPQFSTSSVEGTAFWSDYSPSENLGVVATYAGRSWVEDQHLYLWRKPGRQSTQQEDQGWNGEQTEHAQAEEALRESAHGLEAQSAGRAGSPTPSGRQAQNASPEDGSGVNQEQAAERLREAEVVREIELPADWIVERVALMRRGDEAVVVLGRWRPWPAPPLEKLSRYLRSYADATLRPEGSLYLYPLPSGPVEYWGPGHTLNPSPDRRKAILLRSGAYGGGYYSLHLWDLGQDRLTTIVSLREADPGSGRSFDYEWSRDSRAIHISGATSGFKRRSQEKPHDVNVIYLLGEEGLYDLQKTVE